MDKMATGRQRCVRILLITLLVGSSACASAVSAETPTCDMQAGTSQACSCDLRSLRPLQGAIGMMEAVDISEKIRTKPVKEMANLANDPIKTVRGPRGNLFITDHHHGAMAWLLAGYASGICQIDPDLSALEPAQFWTTLQERHLIRLADQDGKPISPDALPKSLEQMPDDPYRTFASLVRKAHGFCRANMTRKEFAEFQWADWMRGKLAAAKVAASPADALSDALALVRSPQAADQPGYVGNNPNAKCPND
jgi:hypothetical protein